MRCRPLFYFLTPFLMKSNKAVHTCTTPISTRHEVRSHVRHVTRFSNGRSWDLATQVDPCSPST